MCYNYLQEATVLCIDVGIGMQDAPQNEDSSFDLAVQVASMLIQRKVGIGINQINMIIIEFDNFMTAFNLLTSWFMRHSHLL